MNGRFQDDRHFDHSESRAKVNRPSGCLILILEQLLTTYRKFESLKNLAVNH